MSWHQFHWPLRQSTPLLHLLLVSVVPVALCGGEQCSTCGQWKAGVAKVKITPSKPLMMGGYASRNRPADGTTTDLWAKALVVQDGSGSQTVLITADVNNITRDISTFVSQKLQAEFGLRRSAIALNASHTHSGPAIGNRTYYTFSNEQKQALQEYTADLRQKLVGVAVEALNNLIPAKLYWGIGRATFAVNRRTNREADVPTLQAEGNLQGPVDHEVPVLFVQDQDKAIKAVVCGYACHATTLAGYQWSSDWPGYAQVELEKQYPGAVALTWIGCGGDQNPLPRRQVQLAQEYGRRLAQAVERVRTGDMHPIGVTLACSYDEIDLPFAQIPSRETLHEQLAENNRFVAARASRLLQQLDENGSLCTTYPYPVQVWKLGDGPIFVILGGEVVVDYSLRLKQELDVGTAWVAGYSNDVMAYIPSQRVLREGGYEGGASMVYAGLPSRWANGIEEKIVSEVHRQVQRLRAVKKRSER